MTYIKELSEISLSRMSGLRWTDIVEIIILAFVLYYVLVWIKNTKAWSVLKGFFVIVAFILIAAYFEMNTIIWIVQNTFGVVATAVVVILQPELRKAIDELGRKNILTSILPFEVGRSSPEGRFSDKTINEIAKACVEMGKVKTGALIVIKAWQNMRGLELTWTALLQASFSSIFLSITPLFTTEP